MDDIFLTRNVFMRKDVRLFVVLVRLFEINVLCHYNVIWEGVLMIRTYSKYCGLGLSEGWHFSGKNVENNESISKMKIS
jgi:hypothetical protein